jgi:hypothetical protein
MSRAAAVGSNGRAAGYCQCRLGAWAPVSGIASLEATDSPPTNARITVAFLDRSIRSKAPSESRGPATTRGA